ncbi:hypothetical protein [Psychrobacillus sp. NPDC096623]|uniref:hypothetical protein n=1 Tax=Psychrobacillus sp. NPDC096623 TaxID=3364492 RepID=UPI003817AC5B
MLLESSGKELFWELCNQLNTLKLVIDKKKIQENGTVESVPFYFHKDIQGNGDAKNSKRQVASVQYNGGKKKIMQKEVTGVTLRFYILPLEGFRLDSILERHSTFRSQKKGPISSSYYDYIFDEPYSSNDVYTSISALFTDLKNEFIHVFDSTQTSLLLTNLPESIKDLPRY